MTRNITSMTSFFAGIAVILLVLTFFSGCTQDAAQGNAAPIQVTIHSAYKTAEIQGLKPQTGGFFIVTNMTLENRGENDYTFNENSASITNGRLSKPQFYSQVTGHGYWGKIPPHQSRTGDVIFGTGADTENLAITFYYHNGKDSFTQNLGTVPMGSYPPFSGTPGGTGSNSQENGTTPPIRVTVNSVLKTTEIQGEKPYAGKVFIVVNMTIENTGDDSYSFDEKSVTITRGGPLTQKLYTQLSNPFYWGPIPAHEKKTGEVVFSVNQSTQNLSLTFFYQNGQGKLIQELGNVPMNSG